MGDQGLTLGVLDGHQYLRLTTFREGGKPVATPVWFAPAGERLYVFTDARSGKVKRIRNNPRVTLAPSSFGGRPRGEEVGAEARVLDRSEHETADTALREKYGWRYRLAQAVISLLGLSARRAFLELRPVVAGGDVHAPGRQLRYADITINDRNPVKSYLQRRRLRDALSVLDEDFAGKVLDFGGGSGELSRILAARFARAEVFCYEPAPDLLEEARRNLSGFENVVPVPSLQKLEGRRFEYVFCLEVFEHLPRRETAQAIRAIRGLLAREGTAVVGVPNELFFPALVKGLFRMTRRYGAFDARPSNVLRAAVGRPPKRRPKREITPGLPYHFHHTGFDHRELRRKLSETFEVQRQFASPMGGELLGSEIYLILKRRDRAPRQATRPGSGSAG
ncbi:MAG TPA: PPOX class F420-dependent oxidoreductase [Rubrobacteraceae bacterium]|nr:PPOX class F420-dependent oxidoreductase [Rubrobacteraceae bacterium]